MYKKFIQTSGLLGFKLKVFSRTKPGNNTYGTVLPESASKSTHGGSGDIAEIEIRMRKIKG